MQTITTSTAQYFVEIQRALDEIPPDAVEAIEHLVALLVDAARSGKTVFLVGNGGSAATASHFACDLSKGTRSTTSSRIRVVALTDNVPIMTAWANDVTYEDIFAEQLSSLCSPQDILIAISCSGTSPNILRAAEAARAANATVVALTGARGTLGLIADICIRTPAGCIEQIEDIHLMVQHLVCCQVRERL